MDIKAVIVFLIAAFVIIILRILISFAKKVFWSIGIYIGKNPIELSEHPKIKNRPVLYGSDVTDMRAESVADPFMVHNNESWFMFFEIIDAKTQKGFIGLATSKDCIDWDYKEIVLKESFHLSYPYVFRYKKTYYMIPETRNDNSIRLYESVEFPYNWRFVKKLMIGNFADASVIYHNQKWWMFALLNYDNLALYYAEDILGLWVEHPKAP